MSAPKLFTEPDKCGAWRCYDFCCINYCEYDHDCQNEYCHVCRSGQFCGNCNNYYECDFAERNHQFQKEAKKK